VTTFYNDIRYHPKIKNIIGRLECSHINKLMLEYDKGNESLENPFPIFDHSRLYGLDKKHPFIKKLYDIPYKHLKFILQDLYEKEHQISNNSVDISSLFQDSDFWAASIFEQMAQYMFGHRIINRNKLYEVLKKKEDNIIDENKDAT
jgi:hypothetical protein